MGIIAALLSVCLCDDDQPGYESPQQRPPQRYQQGLPVTRPRSPPSGRVPQYYGSIDFPARHQYHTPHPPQPSQYSPPHPPAKPTFSPPPAPRPVYPLPPPKPVYPLPPAPRPSPAPAPRPVYPLPPASKPVYPLLPAPKPVYPLRPSPSRLRYPVQPAAQSEYPPTAPAQPQPARQASPGPHKNFLYHEPEIGEDSDYQALRARATEEHSMMVESFKQSHAFKKSHTTRMYARSNRERAKELSEQGKAHKAKMERLNERASEWIFAKNNEDRAPGDPVDLHNLYVKEAITYTERAVQDARRRGDTKIKLIVGKGRHSLQGVAKLKPAIKRLLQTQGLVVELDPKNAGVLIVNLDGRSTDTDSVLSVDDIVRRFEY